MPACVWDLCSLGMAMPSRLCKGYRHSFKSFLRSVSESKLTDSHLNLTAGDGDGGARGEAGNDWLGDEVDEEAQPEVVTDEHDVVVGEDDGDDRDVDENDGDGDKDEVEPEVPADEDNDPREERK